MRIALTTLTAQGPCDVVVSGDDGATAGQVAEALHGAFAPKEHLASVIMHPRAAQAWGATAPAGPMLWVNGRQVPPDTPAGRALHDGAVVTTDARASTATSMAEGTAISCGDTLWGGDLLRQSGHLIA